MSLATFLNGGTVTQLRGLAFLSLSDTGYILRGSISDDGGGGGTATFGTAGTFPCRVDPMGGDERSIAGRIEARSTHVITLPPETSIDASERFRVGTTDFEITAVLERTAEPVRFVEAVEIS